MSGYKIKDNCPHYELDAVAKAEHDAWQESYPADMKKQDREQAKALRETVKALKAKKKTDGLDEDEQRMFDEESAGQWKPTNKLCSKFCKHYYSGKGHPGETVYCCRAEGNEHIMAADFNEAEVR